MSKPLFQTPPPPRLLRGAWPPTTGTLSRQLVRHHTAIGTTPLLRSLTPQSTSNLVLYIRVPNRMLYFELRLAQYACFAWRVRLRVAQPHRIACAALDAHAHCVCTSNPPPTHTLVHPSHPSFHAASYLFLRAHRGRRSKAVLPPTAPFGAGSQLSPRPCPVSTHLNESHRVPTAGAAFLETFLPPSSSRPVQPGARHTAGA